jgi:alpha/beta superfamily hydrolase
MDSVEEKWTYGFWGAAAGAAALAVVGFTWGGWVTGGNAEAMTLKRSQAAVVAVLAPICVERFQANADASANLVALKNISHSWERRDYVVKGGWATFGQNRPFELADACAEALNKL